ncbi:MAG TPA: transglutaminase family protein [Trebonia sp.]|jgi:transglutaminase-like putative cysteine protease|nr:transglutaminase family protein [Trebonia sp.]
MSAGWRLRISHVTEVRYRVPVRASFNEARMTPLALPGQAVLDAGLSVRADGGSGDVMVRNYRDYWGTQVSAFEVPAAHDGLVIEATATVRTSGPPSPPAGERPGWDEIRRTAAGGRLLEYLLPTRLTTLPPDAPAGRAGRTPDAAAHAIAECARERVAFVPGATGVRTSAREAWGQGQGVCQDIAHVTVSLLRAAGLPARYVSGYLHPRADPAPGSTAAGQGHAWVEYWAGQWTPLDPTHGVPVGERHVIVARGRDYADVPPLKGIYHGAPDGAMNVTVEVTRLL